jgi:DNA-binding response OmpR family regulator
MLEALSTHTISMTETPHRDVPERLRPARGRVLLVDDEPSARETLSRLLAADGFEVSVATSGTEAMEMLRRRAPDALVTDLHMPGMDGIELLRETRALHPELIVVVVSGEARRPLAVIEAGADAYIVKPVEADELVSVLDIAIQVTREQRARGSEAR